MDILEKLYRRFFLRSVYNNLVVRVNKFLVENI